MDRVLHGAGSVIPSLLNFSHNTATSSSLHSVVPLLGQVAWGAIVCVENQNITV